MIQSYTKMITRKHLILIVSSTTRTDDRRRLQCQDHIVGLKAQRKPFTFEKAMAIITEGAGKHFDPKVVEAFSHIAEDLYNDRTKLTPSAEVG